MSSSVCLKSMYLLADSMRCRSVAGRIQVIANSQHVLRSSTKSNTDAAFSNPGTEINGEVGKNKHNIVRGTVFQIGTKNMIV